LKWHTAVVKLKLLFLHANKKLFQTGSVVTISAELLHWGEGQVMHPSLVYCNYKEDYVMFSSLYYSLYSMYKTNSDQCLWRCCTNETEN